MKTMEKAVKLIRIFGLHGTATRARPFFNKLIINNIIEAGPHFTYHAILFSC